MADQYIAKQDIFIGRARAHNEGEEVPAENVEANGWEDLVEKVGTKAADEISDKVLEQLQGFDPGKRNVDDVLAYLTDPNTSEGERERVLLAEKNGANRKSIVNPT